MEGRIYNEQSEEFFNFSDKAAVPDNGASSLAPAAFDYYQEDSVDISLLLEMYHTTTNTTSQPPAPSPLQATHYNGGGFQFPANFLNQLSDPVLSDAYRNVDSRVTSDRATNSVDDPGGTTVHSPVKTPRPGCSRKRAVSKSSNEYQVKRERNNIAVRKSRNKTKMRVQETEQRVKELEDENSQLRNRIATLNEELNVLKNLFASAGVAQPVAVKREKE